VASKLFMFKAISSTVIKLLIDFGG